MALFSAGSSHICHLVASVSNVKLTCLPGTHPPAVSPRLCSWSFTLHNVLVYVMYHTSQYSHFLLLLPIRHLSTHDNFLSLLPTHFDSSIDHLQNALDRIPSWMTANLLTLNSSKTEFLLTGLSKQLAKISNSSLNTTHSRA